MNTHSLSTVLYRNAIDAIRHTVPYTIALFVFPAVVFGAAEVGVVADPMRWFWMGFGAITSWFARGQYQILTGGEDEPEAP